MDNFERNVSAVIKCQNCGADMAYDPLTGQLSCRYCKSTREIQKRVPSLRDYEREKVQGNVMYEGNKYVCPNCGGSIDLPPFATSVKCPFCSATNVIEEKDMNGLKPDSILPFLIPQSSASMFGTKWIKSKLYAPFGLKKQFKMDNFKGLYIPSFAFSSRTESYYNGTLGKTRTRTVGSGKNRHTETYTEWFHVSGNWSRIFTDMFVEASLQIGAKEFSKIDCYDSQNAEAYNKEYLAGFYAERYDTPIEECFDKAANRMGDIIRNEIVRHYNADCVGTLNVNPSFYQTKFRYMLLPVWVCNYAYKNKGYRLIINGRNGKTYGEWPKSAFKICSTVLIVLAIIAVILYFVLR